MCGPKDDNLNFKVWITGIRMIKISYQSNPPNNKKNLSPVNGYNKHMKMFSDV